jgi:2-keto-4-pentenoate hydratase
MTHDRLHGLASALRERRAQASALAAVPAGWQPCDLEEAWRVQHHTWGGEEIAGWKVSALSAAQRSAMGVAQPISAPLLAAWTRGSFGLGEFIAPLVECEIAFELGEDLPATGKPYSRDEVARAIRAVRPAIEVVDSRLPPGSGTLLELADDFNNGGFFAGEPVRDWHGIAFGRCAATLHLTRNGERALAASGSGAAILDGDLLGAVVAMANSQCPLYGGLKAGQIITTGTCTGAVPLDGATRAEAAFAGLGTVAVQFTSGRNASAGRSP